MIEAYARTKMRNNFPSEFARSSKDAHSDYIPSSLSKDPSFILLERKTGLFTLLFIFNS